MEKIEASELKLGDIVRTFTGGYHTATVVKIDDVVHLVRPYIHHGDVETTDGILWYIGIEQYTIWENTEVTLVERYSHPIR